MENDENGGEAVSAGIIEEAFKLGGDLWRKPDWYVANSPVFRLNNVKTAVLILHGSQDFRVPVEQGRETYVDLSLLGQDVELRQYDGEGHGNIGLANQADTAYAMLQWFDQHLKRH